VGVASHDLFGALPVLQWIQFSVANPLAQRASVTVNYRWLPDTPVAEVEQMLRVAAANPAIDIAQQGDAVESPASPARKLGVARRHGACSLRSPARSTSNIRTRPCR
jgi:hypothetical protein